MNKVYLDANIILDFLDSSRKDHLLSIDLMNKLIDDESEIVISEDLLTTIYYVVKDKIKVLDFFDQNMDYWNICSFGIDRIKQAIQICKDDPKNDFEDVLQSLSARDEACNYIITNDGTFYNSGVTIKKPQEFLLSK